MTNKTFYKKLEESCELVSWGRLSKKNDKIRGRVRKGKHKNELVCPITAVNLVMEGEVLDPDCFWRVSESLELDREFADAIVEAADTSEDELKKYYNNNYYLRKRKAIKDRLRLA